MLAGGIEQCFCLGARQRHHTVFVGDDLTDEEAFAAVGAGDVTIKVGTASTIATRRLRDPAAVLEFLTALVDADNTRVPAKNSEDTGPASPASPSV